MIKYVKSFPYKRNEIMPCSTYEVLHNYLKIPEDVSKKIRTWPQKPTFGGMVSFECKLVKDRDW